MYNPLPHLKEQVMYNIFMAVWHTRFRIIPYCLGFFKLLYILLSESFQSRWSTVMIQVLVLRSYWQTIIGTFVKTYVLHIHQWFLANNFLTWPLERNSEYTIAFRGTFYIWFTIYNSNYVQYVLNTYIFLPCFTLFIFLCSLFALFALCHCIMTIMTSCLAIIIIE